ncbi:hypothetical protein VCHA53O466_140110 [Vibrio chagasii]|nr:hypothetical protein VCHA53O466_140110 [Vibrio chagasii]
MPKHSIVIEKHHEKPMGLAEFLALCEKPTEEDKIEGE